MSSTINLKSRRLASTVLRFSTPGSGSERRNNKRGDRIGGPDGAGGPGGQGGGPGGGPGSGPDGSPDGGTDAIARTCNSCGKLTS